MHGTKAVRVIGVVAARIADSHRAASLAARVEHDTLNKLIPLATAALGLINYSFVGY